jgi:hypothetical protein
MHPLSDRSPIEAYIQVPCVCEGLHRSMWRSETTPMRGYTRACFSLNSLTQTLGLTTYNSMMSYRIMAELHQFCSTPGRGGVSNDLGSDRHG